MSALMPLPRWRSAHPDPHKGAGLEGHFTPEVFETPIDCQAIFLSPLAVRRVRPVSAGGLFLMPLSTRPDKSSAQTVRAIFAANATTATLGWARARSARSQTVNTD
ncbi:hypothetical protein Nham_3822 [Nitrobacter hamburgensis X14]|uniref:Uncharacterized protein n=1 Tax=Nitrobacter hamburgensis (strain DSM 10229 / NCIMB 13809 / X14) TaxID=323097 RepID=Q1QGX0_NITHX|nr:hypothetical protein Nham_3822 [Nitrobacter hamburgensis X14]